MVHALKPVFFVKLNILKKNRKKELNFTINLCKHWNISFADSFQENDPTVSLPLQEKLTEDQRKPAEAAPAGAGASAGAKTVGGKYVPPSLRDGANKGKGESMSTQRKGWCSFVALGGAVCRYGFIYSLGSSSAGCVWKMYYHSFVWSEGDEESSQDGPLKERTCLCVGRGYMCSVAHPGGPEAKTIPFTSGSMKISKK